MGDKKPKDKEKKKQKVEKKVMDSTGTILSPKKPTKKTY